MANSDSGDRTTLIINLCVACLAIAVVAETIFMIKAFYKTNTVSLVDADVWPVWVGVPFLFVFRRRSVSILFLVMYSLLFLILTGGVWSIHQGIPLKADVKGLTFPQAVVSITGWIALLYCLIRAISGAAINKFKGTPPQQ